MLRPIYFLFLFHQKIYPHFPIYFNYKFLEYFFQIRGFWKEEFYHRPVAMQEGKALSKAPHSFSMNGSPVIFFKNYCRALNRRGLSRQKNEFVMRTFPLRKAESFFCQLHLKKIRQPKTEKMEIK